MRMLQYRLQLMSSGYVVAGGDVERYNGDDWDDSSLPEIKMEVLTCDTYSDKHDIMEIIEFAEKGFIPKDILNWRLIRFSVNAKGLILEYRNEKLDTTEVVILEKYYKLKLRFYVPRKNGNSEAIYLIDAANYGNTCYSMYVTEYINDIRRNLRFYEKDHEDDNCYDVIVTEYADF